MPTALVSFFIGIIKSNILIKSAIKNILATHEKATASYYRNSNRSEVDLILEEKGKTLGYEFKISAKPRITKNTINMANELNLDHLYIVTPSTTVSQMAPNVTITNLKDYGILFTENQ